MWLLLLLFARENLSLSLVTWTMIKRVHAFNILNSIFRHFCLLCESNVLFSLSDITFDGTRWRQMFESWLHQQLFSVRCVCVCVYFLLLLQCRTADEFRQREQNIRMQQHYWHCSFDLIYLWTDNMHILYHLCVQTECTNCKMSAKGMSNGNGKREKQQN